MTTGVTASMATDRSIVSLERHGHPHAVVVLSGRGHVVLGEETYSLAPHDCVYVAPDEAAVRKHLKEIEEIVLRQL